MGTIITVKCPNCNKQWEHYEGCGFTGANYYCNKCGSGKGIDIDILEDPKTRYGVVNGYGPCKCGGTYTMSNATILCPKCRVPAKDVSDSFILWD